MISYSKNSRFLASLLCACVTAFVALGAHTVCGQTDELALTPPSLNQTPTPIVRSMQPAVTFPQQIGQPTFPPTSAPAAASRAPKGYRLVPLGPAGVNAAVNVGRGPMSGVSMPATAMPGYYVMPSAGLSNVPGTPTPATLRPVPMQQLPPGVMGPPASSIRVAGTPAELPYSFPKPGGPSPGQQPAAPTTRTTTWGQISTAPSNGAGFNNGSMQEPVGNTSSGSMQENAIGTGRSTYGKDVGENPLEPIAADGRKQVTAGSEGGKGASSAVDFKSLPNLNPPMINRIFPNAEPFWMDSAIWKRFDGRRQKVSAGLRNVVSRGKGRLDCASGCNCFQCLRERRKAHRDFGGWVSWGATYNSHGNKTSTGNDPLGFNNFANGLLLNQAWLYAERTADTTTRNFDFGYRVDFLFGADAPDTTAFGDQTWDSSWATSGEYGFALPQAYATIAYKDIFINLGRFYTIVGFESVMAPQNFFYSHSLTFAYNEPFTHTGALVQYNWNQYLTAFAGYTTGWDAGYRNFNEGQTALAALRFDMTENFNLYYATSFGDPGDSSLGESDVQLHSIVANAQLTPNMNYIFQWDYQDRTTFGFEKTNAYAINQNLLLRINDKLAVGTRFEYFRDDDGARIGNGPGEYFDLTLGVNYRTNRNFIVRPEIRYDWFEGAGLPYDDNTERSQFTLGFGGYWAF